MDEPALKDFLDEVSAVQAAALEALSKYLYREKIDLTPVQAIFIANIPDDGSVVGRLRNRKAYYGTNLTYTVKLLIREGYVKSSQSRNDKRSKVVSRTAKGTEVFNKMREWYEFYDVSTMTSLKAGMTILRNVKSSLGEWSP